jgi:hypothetical protein
MKFNFIGPSYTARSLTIDSERTMNLFPELTAGGSAKSQVVLHATPGLRTWGVLPETPLNGLFWDAGPAKLYAVGHGHLYEIDSAGDATLIGHVGGLDAPCTFASNNQELLICNGQQAYLLNGGVITNPVAASMVAFADQYFIALVPNSRQFRISGLLDGSLWDALDIKTIEGQSDIINTVIADHGELWFFGQQHAEVYYDSGNSDFPWERIQGAFIEQGNAAALGPVKLDNSLFWIGSDARGSAIAWRANGYTPVRVSNHAVEYAWAQYSSISDARSYAYKDEGHAFWVITFPSAFVTVYPHATVTRGATWVYDASTQMWHERGYWDSVAGEWKQHLASYHVYAYDRHLVG